MEVLFNMLTGKHILLGVTGGIAAYKTATLASMLAKLHADVHVIMTKNAEKIIGPVAFEALTGNKVIDDVFDRDSGFHVAHRPPRISLQNWRMGSRMICFPLRCLPSARLFISPRL